MYREDLDELVAMFQPCEKVTISDNKYRYESLDEMKQHVGPKVKDFDIRGENPSVRFLFNQTEVLRGSNPPTQTVFNELRTEEISEPAEALFYKIKSFLNDRQRSKFRMGWLAPLIASLIGVFWFAIRNSHANAQGQPVIYLGVLLLTSVVVFVVCLVAATYVQNYLSLETRRNSASFWIKNREDFAKHAITVLISLAVGGVIGFFIEYLKK